MKWPLEVPRFVGILIMPFVVHYAPWPLAVKAAAAFAIVITGSAITSALYKRSGLD